MLRITIWEAPNLAPLDPPNAVAIPQTATSVPRPLFSPFIHGANFILLTYECK
jgi:hypothetical protein